MATTLPEEPMVPAAPDHPLRQPTALMLRQTGQSSCREGEINGGVAVELLPCTHHRPAEPSAVAHRPIVQERQQ